MYLKVTPFLQQNRSNFRAIIAFYIIHYCQLNINQMRTNTAYLKRLNWQTFEKQNETKDTPAVRSVNDRPSSGHRVRPSSIHRFILLDNAVNQTQQCNQDIMPKVQPCTKRKRCVEKTVYSEALHCNHVAWHRSLGQAILFTAIRCFVGHNNSPRQ